MSQSFIWKGRILLIAGTLLAVGLFCVCFKYGVLDNRSQVSQSKDWSIELREGFIDGCKEQAPKEHFALFSMYCPCMATGIEKAGVIPTNYNTLEESSGEVEQRISELTGVYLESSDGKNLLQGCFERAQLALQLEGPRGGNVHPASVEN
ncbi:hypothetical protein GW915_01635 [bacterium]|nr:hypothetical protein [bacterium]